MPENNWCVLSPEETAEKLKTYPDSGLSHGEAESRLKKYGKNVIESGKKDRIIFVFLRQFSDFMVMVLMGAAIISAACGEMIDAMMILAIILLNGILGFVQEYKAEKSLEALKGMYTAETLVLRSGQRLSVPSEDLVPGDVVILNQGDKAGADLRLIQSYNIEVEEAILTGESHYVTKTAASVPGGPEVGDRKNMVFSGTTIVKGRGLGIVTTTGMATEMGKIAGLLGAATNDPTPLQLRLKTLGKWLIAICVGVCAIVSVLGITLGGDVYTMILTGVSLGVASIPEGLPAIVTICLALGVWRLAKCNAIVKKLPAVETLGSTTVICSDKTGTLTENSMVLAELYAGSRWQPASYQAAEELNEVVKSCLAVMSQCHSLRVTEKGWDGDPTELALFQGAREMAPYLEFENKTEHEIPFDSRRRMMSVLVGNTSLVKGAPGAILQCCNKIFTNRGAIELSGNMRETIRQEAGSRSAKGYRVLALAYRDNATGPENMESSLTFLGLTSLADPIRGDVFDAMRKADTAGIKSVMITGDHNGTALAVAKELGMASGSDEVALGKDVQAIGKKPGQSPLKKKRVFARVSPEDKMKIVHYYKSQGEVVAMTGDGVNDAPALKEADIGIAMGRGGADVTKEAADFILTDNNFASIVQAVEEGRGIYDNIRKFIRYLLSSNLGEVLTMFIAVAFGFPLPLAPLQILWINLVTDGLPALALGMEKPGATLMQKPPRPKNEGIFSAGLGRKIVVRGIIIGLTSILVFLGAIVYYGHLETARTMAFTALVFSQLFYVFDCRSEDESPFSLGFFTNRYLVGAVAFSAALQCLVLYVPWFRGVYHTVALDVSQWAVIIILTILPTLLSSLRYFFKKKIKNI